MESPQPKSNRTRWYILAGVLALLVIAAAIFYPSLRQKWQAPLGPGLDLPTHTPGVPVAHAAQATTVTVVPSASPTATLAMAEPLVTSPVVTAILSATASIPITPTGQPLCGGPATMFVLAIGSDNHDESYQYGLADVIRVAHVDFVTPKLTVLTFPRDLWVQIPGIADHYNIDHGKLNQSYFYGNPGMHYYDGPGGGAGLLARTLDLNFGIQVNHYGAVNMLAFAKIIDAVGGVDIYLPTDVDGTPVDDITEDMGYFYAGMNHMNGTQAMHFARIRKRYSDFQRQQFQNMVLCALRKKVLTPTVLPKLPQIITSLKDSVFTDLSPEQMTQMACLLPKLDKKNIILTGFPQELMKLGTVYSPQQKDNTSIVEADYNVLRDYVTQFVNGTWPTVNADKPSCGD